MLTEFYKSGTAGLPTPSTVVTSPKQSRSSTAFAREISSAAPATASTPKHLKQTGGILKKAGNTKKLKAHQQSLPQIPIASSTPVSEASVKIESLQAQMTALKAQIAVTADLESQVRQLQAELTAARKA